MARFPRRGPGRERAPIAPEKIQELLAALSEPAVQTVEDLLNRPKLTQVPEDWEKEAH